MFQIARNSTGSTEGRKPIQAEVQARAVALALATKHGEAFQLWDATTMIDLIAPARPEKEIEADIKKMVEAVEKLPNSLFTTDHYKQQFDEAAGRVRADFGADCQRLLPIIGDGRQGLIDLYKF